MEIRVAGTKRIISEVGIGAENIALGDIIAVLNTTVECGAVGIETFKLFIAVVPDNTIAYLRKIITDNLDSGINIGHNRVITKK